MALALNPGPTRLWPHGLGQPLNLWKFPVPPLYSGATVPSPKAVVRIEAMGPGSAQTMLGTQGMKPIVVVTMHHILCPTRLFSAWDTELEKANFRGRRSWRGAEKQGTWDALDDMTPDGCTWLRWGRECLTLCPAPPTCIWAMSMRCWAGKCQRILKYPKWELQICLKCIPNFLSQQAMSNPWAKA